MTTISQTMKSFWLTMASFHFEVSPISRGQGRSAAGAIAYACREKLHDPYLGLTHDHSRKRDLLHCEVMLPAHAPRSFSDRQELCDAIENAEKRVDSRTLRNIRAALPNELSRDEQISLAREFVNENFVTQGMCAVVAIHEGRNPDPAKDNPHVHILLTTRPVDRDGLLAKKTVIGTSAKGFLNGDGSGPTCRIEPTSEMAWMFESARRATSTKESLIASPDCTSLVQIGTAKPVAWRPIEAMKTVPSPLAIKHGKHKRANANRNASGIARKRADAHDDAN